nr:uncharacterized protein LOC112009816 isoform X1 [Quercus suber]
MACVGSLMPRPSQCLMYATTATTTCKTKHSSSLLPFTYPRNSSRRRIVSVRAESSSSMATESEKLGIKIERNPPDSKLTQLGVRNWPKLQTSPTSSPVHMENFLHHMSSMVLCIPSMGTSCQSLTIMHAIHGLGNHISAFSPARSFLGPRVSTPMEPLTTLILV